MSSLLKRIENVHFNECTLRMSAHALRCTVCREGRHTLLQQSKTKHRWYLHEIRACSQDFHLRKCTSFYNECAFLPSGILCTRGSNPWDTRYDLVASFVKHVWSHDIRHMVHHDRSGCWDICRQILIDIQHRECVNEGLADLTDILRK